MEQMMEFCVKECCSCTEHWILKHQQEIQKSLNLGKITESQLLHSTSPSVAPTLNDSSWSEQDNRKVRRCRRINKIYKHTNYTNNKT